MTAKELVQRKLDWARKELGYLEDKSDNGEGTYAMIIHHQENVVKYKQQITDFTEILYWMENE